MEGLPDLDNGPEVYETSDIDSIEELSRIDIVPHEHINLTLLNAATAQAKFEDGSTLVAVLEDSFDFLGNLNHNTNVNAGYTVLRQKETKEQKLKRIAQELQELQGEDNAEKEQLNFYQSTLEELSKSAQKGSFTEKLSDLLKRLDSEAKRVQKADLQSADIHKQAVLPADPEILDCENRLHEIEKTLGLETLGDHQSLNLNQHLKALERKVEFIYDPDYEIEAIKGKIQSMNAELDALDIKIRMKEIKHGTSETHESDTFEKSVVSLHNKLESVEKYVAILPYMLARLKTLNEIHFDIAGKAQAIGDIDSTLDTLTRDLKSWNENLDLLNGALDEQARTFKDNVAHVEKTVAGLELKLGGASAHRTN